MYLIVTENLRCARETGRQQGPVKGPIMPNQLVTLKVHLRKTLAPRYEVKPLLHVKPLLQANEAINRLPAYDTFGRKGKLAIHPDNIPDTRAVKP